MSGLRLACVLLYVSKRQKQGISNRNGRDEAMDKPVNIWRVYEGPTGYDYKNQAWFENGRYVRCGHPEAMDCQCYGRLHDGEQVSQ
jgi:hypothetical protein